MNTMTNEVLIYDVTGVSDHLLWSEEAFVSELALVGIDIRRHAIQKYRGHQIFTSDGAITEYGLNRVHEDDRGHAHRITTFTQARYRIRYAKLANVIKKTLRTLRVPSPSVAIATLAVGTGGYIPDDTRKGLKRIFGTRTPAYKAIIAEIITLSHRLVIKVYGAWRAEQEAHDIAVAVGGDYKAHP